MTTLQNAKGTRDSDPATALQRGRLLVVLKKTFERFGFAPLETPVLERFDVLASKYAGGEEILKEIFTLEDQGKRKLALRYDLTVPLCRYVGSHPELKMPFKRYQTGPVFRDGPIKLGRYREFWQCDVDTVGCAAMTADAELIALAEHALTQMGFSFEIRINNRKLLNALLSFFNVPADRHEHMILALDKIEKISVDAVKKELIEKGLDKTQTEKLLDLILGDGAELTTLTLIQKSQIAKQMGGDEGYQEIVELFKILQTMNVHHHIRFDPSLARGLAYYTGTVFECFLKGSPITSAVCAGGRYDNMIGRFLGSKLSYPSVGISFGLDVLADALAASVPEGKGKAAQQATATQVFVAAVGKDEQVRAHMLSVSSALRAAGINTETDLTSKGPSKNLDYANAKGIPFVVLIGEDELKAKKVQVKDMTSGKQEQMTTAALVKKLQGREKED